MSTINFYENDQLNNIRKWENEEPSVVSQAIGFVTKPVSWVANKIVPQKAIQGALVGFNSVAKALTDENDILGYHQHFVQK